MEPASGALAPIPVKGFDPTLALLGAEIAIRDSSFVHKLHPVTEQAQVFAGIAGTVIGNVLAAELRKGPEHAEAFLVSILILVDSTVAKFGYDAKDEIIKFADKFKAAAGQAVQS